MQTSPRSDLLTIPNLISLARLLATPFQVLLMVRGPRLGALGLFLLIGISDWLDGTIARATGTVSELGILLDPVSDRICVTVIAIALLLTDSVAWWLAVPIIVREVVLSAAFLALQRSGYGRPKVKRVGKVSLAVLSVATAFLIADGSAGRLIGSLVLVIGTALSYFAAFKYGQEVVHTRRAAAA